MKRIKKLLFISVSVHALKKKDNYYFLRIIFLYLLLIILFIFYQPDQPYSEDFTFNNLVGFVGNWLVFNVPLLLKVWFVPVWFVGLSSHSINSFAWSILCWLQITLFYLLCHPLKLAPPPTITWFIVTLKNPNVIWNVFRSSDCARTLFPCAWLKLGIPTKYWTERCRFSASMLIMHEDFLSWEIEVDCKN